FAGLDIPENQLRRFLDEVPFTAHAERRHEPPRLAVPEVLAIPQGPRMSTQEGFGRLLNELSRDPGGFTDRIVTTSPDVTVSTNLGPWVNRRGLFDRRSRADLFREEAVASAQKWEMSPGGQHIELGIAENNLFLLLAALGLSGPLFGVRLLPIGTLYDPFICRGLDALNYACYQGAKFLLVAAPSCNSMAPEGGAHQSVITPLIGIGQPGMTAFEPAFVDELAVIVAWALGHIQADDGRTAIRHRPRRLLVVSPGARGESGGCLLRRCHAPGRRGARPDPRGYPRGRAAGGDFGRPAPRGLAGRRPRAQRRPAGRPFARRDPAECPLPRRGPCDCPRWPSGDAFLAGRRGPAPRRGPGRRSFRPVG